MKKEDVTIKGITYTVHATTHEGVKKGIAQLKRDLKKMDINDEREEK